jgi:hypothetical protein
MALMAPNLHGRSDPDPARATSTTLHVTATASAIAISHRKGLRTRLESKPVVPTSS